MNSAFNPLDRLTGQAIDSCFGELVRIIPWAAKQYTAGGPDHSRLAREVKAIVTQDQGVERSDGEVVNARFGVVMTAGEIRISLARHLFSSPDDYPHKEDLVQALSRVDKPLFVVVRLAPDNAERLVLHCAKTSCSGACS